MEHAYCIIFTFDHHSKPIIEKGQNITSRWFYFRNMHLKHVKCSGNTEGVHLSCGIELKRGAHKFRHSDSNLLPPNAFDTFSLMTRKQLSDYGNKDELFQTIIL